MEERAWIRTKRTVHRLLLGIYCHVVSGVHQLSCDTF